MKIGITVQGGDDLAKRLQQLPLAMSVKAQRDALIAGAEPMRAYAEAHAPRSSGPGPHMADHIVIAPVSAKRLETISLGHDAAVEVGPEKRFFYGYFAEYGTAHQPARPFMRPAFDTKAQASLGIVVERLWAVIRKALPQSFGASRTGGGAGR